MKSNRRKFIQNLGAGAAGITLEARPRKLSEKVAGSLLQFMKNSI